MNDFYYKYANESVESRKKERFLKAISAYNELITQYPQTQYRTEANDLKIKTDRELKLLNQQPDKISSNTNIKTQ